MNTSRETRTNSAAPAIGDGKGGRVYRVKEREGAKTAPGAPMSGPAPTVGQAPAYTPDFLRFWAAYPRKNDKRKAFRCWQARLKEGLKAGDLVTAADNYAAYYKKHGTEKRYVKHAATFLGPDRPCSEWLDKDKDRADETEKEKRSEERRVG